MYKYGNLIYNNSKGWIFITDDDEEENLATETFIGSLNYLGEEGWELELYDEDLGYILKLEE